MPYELSNDQIRHRELHERMKFENKRINNSKLDRLKWNYINLVSWIRYYLFIGKKHKEAILRGKGEGMYYKNLRAWRRPTKWDKIVNKVLGYPMNCNNFDRLQYDWHRIFYFLDEPGCRYYMTGNMYLYDNVPPSSLCSDILPKAENQSEKDQKEILRIVEQDASPEKLHKMIVNGYIRDHKIQWLQNMRLGWEQYKSRKKKDCYISKKQEYINRFLTIVNTPIACQANLTLALANLIKHSYISEDEFFESQLDFLKSDIESGLYRCDLYSKSPSVRDDIEKERRTYLESKEILDCLAKK